jgi:hypothetical protein
MAGKQAALKRRTTLTLPADALSQAEKIARSRHVNLSTVIAEGMSQGLRLESGRLRRDSILDNYRKAFAGFSAEELAILDGVILEPVSKARRPLELIRCTTLA